MNSKVISTFYKVRTDTEIKGYFNTMVFLHYIYKFVPTNSKAEKSLIVLIVINKNYDLEIFKFHMHYQSDLKCVFMHLVKSIQG